MQKQQISISTWPALARGLGIGSVSQGVWRIKWVLFPVVFLNELMFLYVGSPVLSLPVG